MLLLDEVLLFFHHASHHGFQLGRLLWNKCHIIGHGIWHQGFIVVRLWCMNKWKRLNHCLVYLRIYYPRKNFLETWRTTLELYRFILPIVKFWVKPIVRMIHLTKWIWNEFPEDTVIVDCIDMLCLHYRKTWTTLYQMIRTIIEDTQDIWFTLHFHDRNWVWSRWSRYWNREGIKFLAQIIDCIY